jgi:hypothetical protein
MDVGEAMAKNRKGTLSLVECIASNPNGRRTLNREGLLLEATEAVLSLMKKQHVTRARLCNKLECSKTYLDNLLSCVFSPNLNTISDVFDALGYKVKLTPIKLNKRGL